MRRGNHILVTGALDDELGRAAPRAGPREDFGRFLRAWASVRRQRARVPSARCGCAYVCV